jgi:hypothetical protein
MRAPADIAVYDENDQISALVEVKAVPESSAEWAAEIRHDIIETSGFTPRYFLVVARDASYFWTTPAKPSAPPDDVLSTNDTFRYYLQYAKTDAQSIDPGALELMVGVWLKSLARQGEDTAGITAREVSRLASAIENGRIKFLAAA